MDLRNAVAAAVLAGVVAGCAAGPQPRAVVPGLAEGLDGFVAGHPPAEHGIRVDQLARTDAASVHVVQATAAEAPHRHREHDLTVTLLRGSGTLTLEGVAVPMRAGDVAFVARGRTHWFAPADDGPAIAVVVFAPPFDGRDNEPVR